MNKIDNKIISYLFEHEYATTTELAKHCYNIEDRKDLISKDSLIRYHIQQLVDNEIVERSGKKKFVYSIEKRNIVAGESVIRIDNGNTISEIDLGFVITIIGSSNRSINIIMFDE